MILEFNSSLSISFKDELEQLFFFNEEQSVVYTKIEKALAIYGNPRIIRENNKVRIGLEKMEDCQNLMLSDKEALKLLGIIIHSRIAYKEVEIIHIAINKNFEKTDILEIMIQEIIRIYKRIKGIEHIKITYTGAIIKLNRNE